VKALDRCPVGSSLPTGPKREGRDFVMANDQDHTCWKRQTGPHPRRATVCDDIGGWSGQTGTRGFSKVGLKVPSLANPWRNRYGHGYDPMFKPMATNLRRNVRRRENAISHRAECFRQTIGLPALMRIGVRAGFGFIIHCLFARLNAPIVINSHVSRAQIDTRLAVTP